MTIKTLLYPLLMISCIQTIWSMNNSISRFPIQPSSAWRIDSIDAMWHVCENTKFFINGDTTINNIGYYKLFKTGVAFYNSPFYYSNAYVGAIRDEANRIYFIKRNKTTEVLQFDFNLEVGDTIKSAIGKGKTILSIDTLLDGRKVFHYDLSYFTTSYFIEGIGTNGGLFSNGSHFFFIHSGETACHLVCYAENNQLVYQSNIGYQPNCDIVNVEHQFSIEPTATWRIDTDQPNPSDELTENERSQYFISGDTVINSISYFKFCKTGYNLFCSSTGVNTTSFNRNVYMGAIRNENKKIYFIKKESSNEVMLYNFELKIGDIIKSLIYYGDTVARIDTILDNRKVFYINDNWGDVIIEGIGCTRDFLDNKRPNTYLRCYSENNISIYQPNQESDCLLDFKNTTFPVCNSIQQIPEVPTSADDIKLKITTCYQIPVNGGTAPVFAGSDVAYSDKGPEIDLYYINTNDYSGEDILIPYTITDTLLLGQLAAGMKTVRCIVNTIHQNIATDTVFNEREFISLIYISSASGVKYFTNKDDTECKIYPVPANEKIIVVLKNGTVGFRSIDLFNLTGVKITSVKVGSALYASNRYEINVRGLKKGIYILKVNKKNSCFTERIILN